MCGRYVLKREDLETVAKKFGIRSLGEFSSRHNIAPTSMIPVIRRRNDASAELAAVRWGLIPAWAKPDAPVKPIINLRTETLITRFKGALRSRRCLVPASGFYEWQATGARKQPWLFTARDGGPIGLAGIWDTWRGDGGVELETCTILTTTPNRVLQPIHDRMPVLLSTEQCQAWLDETNPARLEQLLVSAPDDAIVGRKVGPAVSSVRNDGPECLAEASDEPPSAIQAELGL